MASERRSDGGHKLTLYSYWRSSCSWRVRIALHHKGLAFDYKPVNLLKREHLSLEFTALNPLGYVPALVDGDVVISDSLAILLYLEERYPEHSLLPTHLHKRALNLQIKKTRFIVRIGSSPCVHISNMILIAQVANIIGSSIQPLQNVSVLNYIEEKIGSEEKIIWAQKQIGKGFAAIEKLLKDICGKYATGDEVYLADMFLAPQIGNAARFNVDMSPFPTLSRINEAYKELPAFQAARPENQPDAVKP